MRQRASEFWGLASATCSLPCIRRNFWIQRLAFIHCWPYLHESSAGERADAGGPAQDQHKALVIEAQEVEQNVRVGLSRPMRRKDAWDCFQPRSWLPACSLQQGWLVEWMNGALDRSPKVPLPLLCNSQAGGVIGCRGWMRR